MKVVINKCYGGFNLSDAAVEACIERGMTCTTYSAKGDYLDKNADFVRLNETLLGTRYSKCRSRRENEFRCHPVVVAVVEKLGKKANGPFSKLKVIEIPFDSPDGWEIDEYDGMERVVPVHDSWE